MGHIMTKREIRALRHEKSAQHYASTLPTEGAPCDAESYKMDADKRFEDFLEKWENESVKLKAKEQGEDRHGSS